MAGKDKTKPKEAKAENAPAKTMTELKAEFKKRKEIIIKFEKNNYESMVFFRGMNDFFIAGNHSAVIGYNLIAPDCKLKIPIHQDGDFEPRFELGMLIIKNVEKYKKLFMSSDLLEGFEQTDDKIVFKLKKPLTPEEYKVIENMEEIRREELVNMVSSTRVLPKTYQKFREVMQICYQAARKHSQVVERDLYTGRLVDESRKAFLDFLNGCKNSTGFQLAMNQVDEDLKALLLELVVIEAAGVWTVSQCRNVAFPVVKVRECLAVERKQYN